MTPYIDFQKVNLITKNGRSKADDDEVCWVSLLASGGGSSYSGLVHDCVDCSYLLRVNTSQQSIFCNNCSFIWSVVMDF